MKNSKKGFTLVELIVVISILAILALILVPSIIGYTAKAKETTCDLNKSQLKQEITIYIESNSLLLSDLSNEPHKAAITAILKRATCPFHGEYKLDTTNNTITITCNHTTDAPSQNNKTAKEILNLKNIQGILDNVTFFRNLYPNQNNVPKATFNNLDLVVQVVSNTHTNTYPERTNNKLLYVSKSINYPSQTTTPDKFAKAIYDSEKNEWYVYMENSQNAFFDIGRFTASSTNTITNPALPYNSQDPSSNIPTVLTYLRKQVDTPGSSWTVAKTPPVLPEALTK